MSKMFGHCLASTLASLLLRSLMSADVERMATARETSTIIRTVGNVVLQVGPTMLAFNVNVREVGAVRRSNGDRHEAGDETAVEGGDELDAGHEDERHVVANVETRLVREQRGDALGTAVEGGARYLPTSSRRRSPTNLRVVLRMQVVLGGNEREEDVLGTLRGAET